MGVVQRRIMKKNLKKSLKYRLEDLRSEAKEVYSVMNVVYDYCKYRNDSETVDNILNLLKNLVERTGNIDKTLCTLLNEDSKTVSSFLDNITPLNFEKIDVED